MALALRVLAATILTAIIVTGCSAQPPAPARRTATPVASPTPTVPVSRFLEVPASLTFEAGATLDPGALPTLSTTILDQPGWSYAEGSDETAATRYFDHLDTGCALVLGQAESAHPTTGPLDDYAATRVVVTGLLHSEILPLEATEQIAGNDGAIGTTGLSLPVDAVGGGKGYLVARAFGASGIEMVMILSCPDTSATPERFREWIAPHVAINFLVP